MVNFDTFKEIVYKDVQENIIKSQRKKKEDGSFGELLFKSFSLQSVNIKMGHVLERSWKKFVSSIEGVFVENLNMIEGSQVDILFDYNETKYYFESKNNLNIDTEKTIATKNKVEKIKDFLSKENDSVVAKILMNRYSSNETAKFYKHPIAKNDIYGYSQFFDIFGIVVTKEDWEDFFLEVGTYIFDNISKDSK